VLLYECIAKTSTTFIPTKDKKAVLLQGEPRDATVNFDTYLILQRLTTCGFPATARLSCWSLSADSSESSVKK